MMFFDWYMWLYSRTLGMSLTDWLRRDFEREPLVYLAGTFILSLWLNPQPRNKWLLSVVVFAGVLIGHVWTRN